MASSRASTLSVYKREFWGEFFLLYEGLPALWDTRSVLYKERAAKIAAYDVLVEKLREIEPNADREDVLRKINIFRTNFRREVSRINLSEKLGKKYKTTLWYFDFLSFLRNQESRRRKRDTTDGEKCVMPKRRLTGLGTTAFIVKKTQNEKTEEEETCYAFDGNDIEETENEPTLENSSVTSENEHFQNEFRNFSLERKIPAKLEPDDDVREIENGFQETEGILRDEHEARVVGDFIDEGSDEDTVQWCDDDDDETLKGTDKPSQKPAQTKSFKTLSELRNVQNMAVQTTESVNVQATRLNMKSSHEVAEILAKSWAIQYEEMAADQKIFARKAIADILFDGCMGNLGHYTAPIDGAQYSQQNLVATNDCEQHRRATIINERIFLKQHPATKGQEDVNGYEECYMVDDVGPVKIQDWAVKM